MRRKKLARLLRKLRAMRRSCPKRDQLLMRVGAAKTDAGRAFGFVKIKPKPTSGGPGSDQGDVHVSIGQGQAERDRTARRPLSAADQPGGGRSGRVVGSLCATDTDRSGVQMPEERSGRPADPPSTGATGRRA